MATETPFEIISGVIGDVQETLASFWALVEISGYTPPANLKTESDTAFEQWSRQLLEPGEKLTGQQVEQANRQFRRALGGLMDAHIDMPTTSLNQGQDQHAADTSRHSLNSKLADIALVLHKVDKASRQLPSTLSI